MPRLSWKLQSHFSEELGRPYAYPLTNARYLRSKAPRAIHSGRDTRNPYFLCSGTEVCAALRSLRCSARRDGTAGQPTSPGAVRTLPRAPGSGRPTAPSELRGAEPGQADKPRRPGSAEPPVEGQRAAAAGRGRAGPAEAGSLTMVPRRRAGAGPAGCRLPPVLPARGAPGEAPTASRLPTMPRKETPRRLLPHLPPPRGAEPGGEPREGTVPSGRAGVRVLRWDTGTGAFLAPL